MNPAVCLETDYEPDDVRDEYYYGYRTIIEEDENGGCSFKYRPLTYEDLLDPEEGDVYMQGNIHTNDIRRLASIFKNHLKEHENLTIYSDMKIEWGVQGLKNPAPDISILKDVENPEKPRSSFSVLEEGVKPFFVLEVVSPRYRRADIVSKPEIYRKAGVSEYIIVDPGLKNNVISYSFQGYRLLGSRYIKIEPDSQNRIISITIDVGFSVSESGDELIVTDRFTREKLLTDAELKEKAEMRAERAEEYAEKERIEKEKAEEELKLLKMTLKEAGIAV